ncbi:hypothetical protein P8452_55481 [Trifolium repens]|nr:hypothetical protein P8452_55481 [Trifolium repens]
MQNHIVKPTDKMHINAKNWISRTLNKGTAECKHGETATWLFLEESQSQSAPASTECQLQKLSTLSKLDMFFNSLTGDLPQTMSSLSCICKTTSV